MRVERLASVIEPKLFAEGLIMNAILLWQAYEDLELCCYLEEIETVFGIPAVKLMARIEHYIDGEYLKEPEHLNYEKTPFKAIKYAHCAEGWENFVARNGRVEELDHLRAYFWDERVAGENLMCITHFRVKTGPKLDPKDHSISTDQKVRFEDYGYHYADN